MKLLAIDTATEACSVALSIGGRVVSRFENLGRGHTQRILPMIDDVMGEGGCAPAQLDAIACGVGPGSFAGVRVGVGIAKGLALALGRPIVAVSSLAMLAQDGFERGLRGEVLAAIDARIGEVYLASFVRDAAGLAAGTATPLVCRPHEAPVPERQVVGLGSGFAAGGGALAARFGARLVSAEPQRLPDARSALPLALAALERGHGLDAEQLEPAYVRNRVALTSREQAALRQGDR